MCARNFEPLNEAPDVASTLREEVLPDTVQLAPDESSKSACVAVALVSCMELPDESSASIRDALSPFISIDEPDDVSSSTFPLDLKPPGMEIDAPDVASSSAGLLIFTTPFTMIDAPDETSRSLIVGDDTVTVISSLTELNFCQNVWFILSSKVPLSTLMSR